MALRCHGFCFQILACFFRSRKTCPRRTLAHPEFPCTASRRQRLRSDLFYLSMMQSQHSMAAPRKAKVVGRYEGG